MTTTTDRLALSLLLSCASGGAPAAAQETALLSPAASHRSFVHDSALSVRLWAAEPDVVAPIALAWDASLRGWVLCGDGELRVREQDGFRTVARFDRPTGFVFHGDALLVAAAGGLERVREPEPGDAQIVRLLALEDGASLSHLVWGLDGWVYCILRASDEYSGGLPTGVARFRPDADEGAELESVVAVPGARSLALSGDGELFVATDEAHFVHVVAPDAAFRAGRVGDVTSYVDGADHSFVQRQGLRAKGADARFGIPGGTLLLEGSPWPEELAGSYLACEPAGGVVHRDELASWGVTFRARRPRGGEFLAAGDPAFRPSALARGPEGGLFVLDRYGDDPARGRIWLLEHGAGDGAAAVPLPEIGLLATRELTYELASPNRWRRETAHRLLRERGIDAGLARELAARCEVSADPLPRIHALWLLPNAGPLLRAALADFDARVRTTALRVLGSRGARDRGIGPASVLGLTGDGDGRVRLEAWRRLGLVTDGSTRRSVADLYPTLADDWSRSLALAVAGTAPASFLASVLRRSDEGELYDLVRLLVLDVVRREAAGDAVSIVLELGGGDASPRIVSSTLRLLEDGMGDLEPWPSPRLTTTLRRLAAHEDYRIASAALPLARRWLGDQLATSELSAWGERILAVMEDEERSLELRLSGFRVLIELPEVRARALGIAEPLLDDRAWADVVLDAVDSERLTRTDLGEERTLRLRRHPDEDVRMRAATVLAD